MPQADLLRMLTAAKSLARRYYAHTGRPMGVTGEVAEYEATRLLNLTLADVRQTGWGRNNHYRERAASEISGKGSLRAADFQAR